MTPIQFIFGLAIFLFAMRTLERGVRLAGGDNLKRWIVDRTNTSVSAAGYGVLVTAIMQSSSMVSLLVLAFVSAEVMPLFSGIGVMLGANLGTTVTGWVVTIVGFKMDLQAMVIPMLGIGAACQLSYIKNQHIAGIGTALFAFGLLILGLDIMKSSVAGVAELFDIKSWSHLPAWVYLAIGVLLASVMQSSSAVMIIALSMLNANTLQLSDAAAVVIGADLGTTSTTVLGSIGQSIIKKQLAFTHVFFNVLVNTLAFVFLLPILPQLLAFFLVTDSMFGLVTFHSTFNLLGLLLFLPLLKVYTRIIKKLIPTKKQLRAEFFTVPVEVPDAAINSAQGALAQLTSDCLRLNWQILDIAPAEIECVSLLKPNGLVGEFEDQYESLKSFEGDLIRYVDQTSSQEVTEQEKLLLANITASARALVYATKTLKDVRHDIARLKTAMDPTLGQQLDVLHKQFFVKVYSELVPMLFSKHTASHVAEQRERITEINANHQVAANDLVSGRVAHGANSIVQMSTWYNLNHELHHYIRYALSAII